MDLAKAEKKFLYEDGHIKTQAEVIKLYWPIFQKRCIEL